jgi:antirestriction protein ArdC
MTSTRSRQDIHAEITNKLIKAIEASPSEPVMPWRKSGKPLWLPENALTRKRYNGINIVSLWVAAETTGYAEPLWATYRQWQQLDAQVRKGEKASLVVFYKLCGRPHNAKYVALANMWRRVGPRLPSFTIGVSAPHIGRAMTCWRR